LYGHTVIVPIDNEIIPSNPPTVQHPQFTFPLVDGKSFSFNDYHYFLPNLENLSGVQVSVSLDVPLSKESKESYLNTVLTYIGASSDVHSVPLGSGFLDLKFKERDVYCGLTMTAQDATQHTVCKMDFQVVKPGLKIDILELQSTILSYEQLNQCEINHNHLFIKSFDRFVSDVTNVQECRKTKAKVELTAQKFINEHVEERIQVHSIDTLHTKSGSGFEMFSCNVWYRFTASFLKATHEQEKERQDRLNKQAEEAKKKLTEKEVTEVDASVEQISLTDSEDEETTTTAVTAGESSPSESK